MAMGFFNSSMESSLKQPLGKLWFFVLYRKRKKNIGFPKICALG